EELVAALAGGAALSFEPDADEDDDLLPGDRVARAEAAVAEAPQEATPEEIAAELAREAAEKDDEERPAEDQAGRPPPARSPGRLTPARPPQPVQTRTHPQPGGSRCPPRDRRTNPDGGHHGGSRQGAPRPDRRGLHGLQARAHRGRRRPRQGFGDP